MKDVLVSILRDRGVDASDRDDMKVLEQHFCSLSTQQSA